MKFKWILETIVYIAEKVHDLITKLKTKKEDENNIRR